MKKILSFLKRIWSAFLMLWHLPGYLWHINDEPDMGKYKLEPVTPAIGDAERDSMLRRIIARELAETTEGLPPTPQRKLGELAPEDASWQEETPLVDAAWETVEGAPQAEPTADGQTEEPEPPKGNRRERRRLA